MSWLKPFTGAAISVFVIVVTNVPLAAQDSMTDGDDARATQALRQALTSDAAMYQRPGSGLTTLQGLVPGQKIGRTTGLSGLPSDGSYAPMNASAPIPQPMVATRPAEPVVTAPLKVDYDPRFRKYLEGLNGNPFGGTPDLSPFQRYLSIGGNAVTDDRTLPGIVALPAPTKCSGVWVSGDIIITAAHCLCLGIEEVQFGSYSGPSAPTYGVEEGKAWMPSSAQCGNTQSLHGNDIAMVRLAETVTVFGQRDIVRIATANVLAELRRTNGEVYVAGFGIQSNRWGVYGQKNFVKSPILSLECDPERSRVYGCVEGKELVALDYRLVNGVRFGVGPCRGDSGGAALVYMDDPDTLDRDPQFFLLGVVSRNVQGAVQCGDGAIFTLMTATLVASLEEAAQQMTGRQVKFAALSAPAGN